MRRTATEILEDYYIRQCLHCIDEEVLERLGIPVPITQLLRRFPTR